MNQNTEEIHNELVNKPLDVIDRLFGTGESQNNFSQVVSQHFINCLLNDQNAYEKIPRLHAPGAYGSGAIATNTLVRYRGMVQDMLEQELFSSVYLDAGSRKTTMYRENIDHIDEMNDFEFDQASLLERSVVYCVPIPGTSSWVNPSKINKMENKKNVGGKKRERMQENSDDEESDEEDAQQSKRRNVQKDQKSTPNEILNSKKSTIVHPLALDNGTPAAVKVYDDSTFKVCEVLEVVGVLSEDYTTFSSEYESQDDTMMSTQVENMPSSLVPRLHCISLKRYCSVQHPYVDEKLIPQLPQIVDQLRSGLIKNIATALRGDTLAAEYVLLHLISGVHMRNSGVVLGKLALNLTRSAGIAERLHKAISQLLPASVLLGLTKDVLLNQRFQPRKNHITNKLESGLLQVAKGTSIIIDENQLSQGAINEEAIKNLSAIEMLLKTQTIRYDFIYHLIEMETDVRVLVLSEGKSMFHKVIECIIPLEDGKDIEQLQIDFDLARRFMALLTHLNSNTSDYSIAESVRNIAQAEFVTARKQNPNTVDETTLHLWLSLGRLISFSFGEKELTDSRWEHMKELEKSRAIRVMQYHPQK
jgi:hypothetical protein